MSAATSSRSPATWSRKRSGSKRSAAAIAVKDKAEDAAMERLLDALTGKDASEATREAFRQRFHDGHLDDTEIEIELEDAPQMPFEIPGGGQVGMINLCEMMGKAFGGQQIKRRKLKVPERLGQAGRGGSRQAPRPGRGQPRRAGRCRGQRHRLPRRDRQDRGQRRARRIGQPRGRPARSAAADRGHHGRDQIRADEDRPYPVHRVGRLPRRQAERPAARTAGPPADPRRAEGADRGGFRRASSPTPRRRCPSSIAR